MVPLTALRVLVAKYEGREQPAVRFRPATWIQELNEIPDSTSALDVLTDSELTGSSESVSGDRVTDRQRVHGAASIAATDNPESILRAFLLVQAWGSGTSGSRTLRHTRAAFEDRENLVHSLSATAQILRSGDDPSAMAEAYGAWRCAGVRRSFFTKWFAFAGTKEEREWQPLILDDRVLSTLNDTLELSTKDIAGTRLWKKRYQKYVEEIHGWAAALAIDASRLEWILFRHNGKSLT